jgi:hypothetical protein
MCRSIWLRTGCSYCTKAGQTGSGSADGNRVAGGSNRVTRKTHRSRNAGHRRVVLRMAIRESNEPDCKGVHPHERIAEPRHPATRGVVGCGNSSRRKGRFQQGSAKRSNWSRGRRRRRWRWTRGWRAGDEAMERKAWRTMTRRRARWRRPPGQLGSGAGRNGVLSGQAGGRQGAGRAMVEAAFAGSGSLPCSRRVISPQARFCPHLHHLHHRLRSRSARPGAIESHRTDRLTQQRLEPADADLISCLYPPTRRRSSPLPLPVKSIEERNSSG